MPGDAYYGIHTLQASENFYIINMRISNVPELVRGVIIVTKTAALANKKLKTLPLGVDADSYQCLFQSTGQMHWWDYHQPGYLRTICFDFINIVTYLNPFIGHYNGDIVGKICTEIGKCVHYVVLEHDLRTAV